MVSKEEKLTVLSKLAAEFNRQDILWAVGASLLLCLRGYVEDFHDIDLMVSTEDAAKAEEILLTFGTLQPSDKGNFATKHFRKFTVDGVEVDLIGGFAIVCDGEVYDCDLQKDQITGQAEVCGQQIPLHSIPLWKHYYTLMGREQKVELIDRMSLAAGLLTEN